MSTPRTQLERDFDPGAVRDMKAAARRDVTIGGPNLAAHAFRAGRIDECHLFLTPVTVGGGNPAFPANLRVNPALLDERRFGSGVIYLHYRVL